MLFTAINGIESFNGFGAVGHTRFGAATRTLVKGTDFNCNTSICFGIGPANHQLLKDLQTTLNRYANQFLTFTPLIVDGFIGDKTVTAVRIATADANISVSGMAFSREGVTANAPTLITGLTEFLNFVLTPVKPTQPSAPTVAVAPQSQPATPTPPQLIPVQQPVRTATTQAQPTTQQPLTPGLVPTLPAAAALLPLPPTTAKIPTWVWVTAGVTGAVVIGLVGYALRKPSPEALGDDDYADYSRRYRRRA